MRGGAPGKQLTTEVRLQLKIVRKGNYLEYEEKNNMNKSIQEKKYIEYATIHRQASDEGNYRITNRAYRELSNIYHSISRDKQYAELFLKDMLLSENVGVQLWAATHSLGLQVNLNMAIETLEVISQMEKIGIIRLSAEMTLKQWKKNKLIV